MKLITKMFLLIAMLMTPVIALYMYSHQQSIRVARDQIDSANKSRLLAFLNEIETTMDQITSYTNIISRDPDFAELASGTGAGNRYDYAALMETAERKLALFSLSTDWMSRFSIYFPAAGRAASSYSSIVYDTNALINGLHTDWQLRRITVNGIDKRSFTRHVVEPPGAVSDLAKASIVMEVDLMEDNIMALLDQFKSKGNNDPFLYKSPDEYILNSSSDERMVRQLIAAYDLNAGGGSGTNQDQVRLNDKDYAVYFYQSPELNWTLVDYVPLEDILSPVTRSQRWFMITTALLLLLGTGAVYLLYVHVQVPLQVLTASIAKLRKGQFSVRIDTPVNREFQAVMGQFNEMAAQIQHLVEQVYLEEIRSKEAVMKQLQSQINPHFLYNSLAYLISMAKLNRPQSIITMAHSLADYYKYTMRNDAMTTTLREEIAFVSSYVEIMNFQLGKIRYETAIPEDMEHALIPRLIIQPVVENAIVHGLEGKPDEGHLRISGSEFAGGYAITVEDNGAGMTGRELALLNARISASESSGGSLGLWNVNQRLRYYFGPESGLTVSSSGSGGVCVVLRWSKRHLKKAGDAIVLDTDR